MTLLFRAHLILGYVFKGKQAIGLDRRKLVARIFSHIGLALAKQDMFPSLFP